jgi:NADH-quinone oxidoreductase subunit J
MIGAILLTHRKREGVKKQSYINQISREPSSSVQIKKVEFDKGVTIDD